MLYTRFRVSKTTSAFIASQLGSGRSVSLMTSVALARSLAFTVPLPDQKEFSYDNYLSTSGIMVRVAAVLSKINEVTVIDFNSVIRYFKALYEFRCSIAFPRETICCTSDDHGTYDFFDMRAVMPKDLLSMIETNTPQLAILANGFTEMLKDPVFVISSSSDGIVA